MKGLSDKVKAVVPLIFILVALTGFIATSAWQQQKDLQVLRDDIETTRKNLANQISAQGDQIANREMAIQALSKDLLEQDEKMKEIEKILEWERKAAAEDREKREEQARMLERQVAKQDASLEKHMKRIKKIEKWANETQVARVSLENEVQKLNNLASQRDRQLMMMKEEFMIKKNAVQPGGYSPSYQPPQPSYPQEESYDSYDSYSSPYYNDQPSESTYSTPVTQQFSDYRVPDEDAAVPAPSTVSNQGVYETYESAY